MNDFTKEELCQLSAGISKLECFNVELHRKLQSMIDNYCEHDWENTCCACSLDSIYCHKYEKRMSTK